VFEPAGGFSANADLWEIRKENTIDSFNAVTMIANYSLFQDQFIRDAAGNLAFIDQRWLNAGERITRGLEVGARMTGKFSTGSIWGIGIDGSRLLEKKSRATKNAEFGESEIGRFLYTGDLGLKWKHSAYVTYKYGNWSGMLQNIFRSGYTDQVLPGVASGRIKPSEYNSKVDDYSIFHLTANYTGFKNLTLTAGIKNILDEDPPFAITYDSNTGAGSSWEPRVADPRGRSFTMMATYKFF
jgi:iron complex outermembrane receptor protein